MCCEGCSWCRSRANIYVVLEVDRRMRYPLTIVTIFHPEHWLGVPSRHLDRLPHQRRDRAAMESAKRQVAGEWGLEPTVREMHGRPIQNFGESVGRLRKTWLHGIQKEVLLSC